MVVTDADGNDAIAIRPMTILGLSWDHRALDGALAAQFLAAVKRDLEGRGRVSTPELWVCRLGMVEYREALALQERVRAARQADAVPDVMLLLEHPPVYTRGRRSGAGELPMGEDWYRMQGIEIVDVNRGGKITYHGPGQLVGYPIVRVDDVVEYIRTLERGLVARSPRRASTARARPEDGPDYTGVWVGERKIASLGVHVARGVTTHGWAVNVENDLQPFSWVVACGLDGVADDLADPGDRAARRADAVLPQAGRVRGGLGAGRGGSGSCRAARLEAAVGVALTAAPEPQRASMSTAAIRARSCLSWRWVTRTGRQPALMRRWSPRRSSSNAKRVLCVAKPSAWTATR